MLKHAVDQLETVPFRGFGPSTFWPFRRRRQTLEVSSDFAEVRRSMRDECPRRPGVYGMIDARQQLIYIGMSTVLPKRLVTYFQSGSEERKEYRIAAHTKRLVWEVVGHGLAAELRELELIRHHQPRFNVRGRRARRALGYIFVSREDAPRVRVARQVPRGVRHSRGPLVVTWRIREAIEAVNRYFKLRDCRVDVPMHFAEQKNLFSYEYRMECVRGETGSCLGPCGGQCTRSQYMAQVRAVRAFLDGDDLTPLSQLETELKTAVLHQQFERAAGLRDRLTALSFLTDRLTILREPPMPGQFIYSTTAGRRPVWFLVAANRVVAALPAPVNARQAAVNLQGLRSIYNAESLATVETDRLATQILAGWFRSHPAEWNALLAPGDAMAMCERMQAS